MCEQETNYLKWSVAHCIYLIMDTADIKKESSEEDQIKEQKSGVQRICYSLTVIRDFYSLICYSLTGLFTAAIT